MAVKLATWFNLADAGLHPGIRQRPHTGLLLTNGKIGT